MTEKLLRDFHTKFDIPYSYCEYYTCCRTIPCKLNSVYQKNHDFRLMFPIKDNEKYLFLYREDKIEQLEAYYRYTENQKQEARSKKQEARSKKQEARSKKQEARSKK